MANDPSEVAIHRVNLVSSIIKEFVVEVRLTMTFFERALKFWQSQMELSLVSRDNSQLLSERHRDVYTASCVMEGGSVWSRSLSKYRKMVTVNFCGLKNYSYVNVRIDLPGAYRLNASDIDQAVEIIDRFRAELMNEESAETVDEGVVAKEAV